MKKLFKTVILFFIIFSISSCRDVPESFSDIEENKTSVPSASSPEIVFVTPPANINTNDNVFELTSSSFFFSNENELYGHDYSDDRQQWTQLVESEFGISLKIKSVYAEVSGGLLPSGLYNKSKYDNLVEMIESGEIIGLYALSTNSMLHKMMEDGLIIPWNFYLQSNTNWLSIPSEIRNAYEFQGNIWAFPTRQTKRGYSRYIRGDWMTDLGIDEPSTIDEFYETLNIFTYSDPDHDGADNTYGADYSYELNGLEDIFAAFDVRMNHEGYFLPVWNPNTNIWEDSLLKDEFSECINFLNLCHENGLIKKTYLTDGLIDFERGNSGSYCSDVSRYEFAEMHIKENRPDDTDPKVTILPGLIHNISTKIYPYYTYYSRPYVLVKSSNHAYSTLNTFIDIFLADTDGYLMGRFGQEDVAYSKEDDKVIYRTTLYNDINYAYRSPSIVLDNPLIQIDFIADHQKTGQDVSTYSSDGRLDMMEASSYHYEVPWNIVYPNISDSTTASIENVKKVSNKLIENVIEGVISLDDAIEQYRNTAKKNGMQEFMDKENEKLGKNSYCIY